MVWDTKRRFRGLRNLDECKKLTRQLTTVRGGSRIFKGDGTNPKVEVGWDANLVFGQIIPKTASRWKKNELGAHVQNLSIDLGPPLATHASNFNTAAQTHSCTVAHRYLQLVNPDHWPPPPLGTISFTFMPFSGKIWPNNRLASPVWKILDPPLQTVVTTLLKEQIVNREITIDTSCDSHPNQQHSNLHFLLFKELELQSGNVHFSLWFFICQRRAHRHFDKFTGCRQ